MYKIAICDDETLFNEELKEKVYAFFNNREIDISLSLFESSQSLLTADGSGYDLYLLDIMMPGISGMELADRIRHKDGTCSIIFISSIQNAVYETFQYAPLRFIRKEYIDQELHEALHAFCLRMEKIRSDISLTFAIKDQLYQIQVQSIHYIESDLHYIIIHFDNQSIRIRERMSNIEEKLLSYNFVRSHRAFLINLKNVESILQNTVYMKNGSHLLIGRSYRQSFTSAFMRYKKENCHVISI